MLAGIHLDGPGAVAPFRGGEGGAAFEEAGDAGFADDVPIGVMEDGWFTHTKGFGCSIGVNDVVTNLRVVERSSRTNV